MGDCGEAISRTALPARWNVYRGTNGMPGALLPVPSACSELLVACVSVTDAHGEHLVGCVSVAGEVIANMEGPAALLGDIRQKISVAMGGSSASVVQLHTSDARVLDGPDDQTLAEALGKDTCNSKRTRSAEVTKFDSTQMERHVTDSWSKFTLAVVVGALAVFVVSRAFSPTKAIMKR